jgi:hypothetical protein
VLATTAFGFAAVAAAATAAPVGQPPETADMNAPAKVRNGIVLGLTVGAGIAGASGYPNDVTKIGDPTYYSASGAMFGASETVLVMGAISDYLNVGFWYSHAPYKNGDWHSSGDGGGLRLEVFPLIALYPRLAGLGLFSSFGIGGGNLVSSVPGRDEAKGTQSFLAAGAFYEWSFAKFLGGHFAFGPGAEFDEIWSLPFERHGVVATARLVFYGGP